MTGFGRDERRLLEHLQLRHLRDFVAVVEEGSFTAAARRRRVSQPTLSTSIRQLERALGGAVLDRSRPVLPTRLGLVVLDHARRLVDVLRSLDAETSALKLRTPRVVRAGVFAVGAGPLTSHLLHAISGGTGLALSITSVDLAQQTARVLDGSLDLVLTYGPFNDPRVCVTPLGHQPRMAAVGAWHPLADVSQARAADVLDFAVPAAPRVEPEWLDWWHLVEERNGERPQSAHVPGGDLEPIVQLRQAAMNSLMVIVPAHLSDALPGPANGLHYVQIVDAAPATGVMLTRPGAGPVIEAIVRTAERLGAVLPELPRQSPVPDLPTRPGLDVEHAPNATRP